MVEPEVDPGAQPGTLASQCGSSENAEEIVRGTEKPLSPNSIDEVAVLDMDLKDGELSAVAEVALGEEKEKEEARVLAGDGDGDGDESNPCVKEEEAEVEEGPAVEVESATSVQLLETAPSAEAVIVGTEEALKEEGSEIDRAVKNEGEDDPVELSVKEEASPAVDVGTFSEEGAIGNAVTAGSDDTMPKEECGVGQKVEVEPMNEAERKEEDVSPTDGETPQVNQEMVLSEKNDEEMDDLQPEDANPTQNEETKMEELMHDDSGADMVMDEDLTQEGGGDKSMNEDLSEAGESDKVMDEDLTREGGGDKSMNEDLSEHGESDKVMDEDLTQEGGGDKSMNKDLSEKGESDMVMDEDLTEDRDGNNVVNEHSASVDGDGLDDNTADDQAARHGEEVMGSNDGEEEDDEDDPPPLPAKKSGSARKKKGRATRIKKGEEELCFICFDGGELVVCDRRSDY